MNRIHSARLVAATAVLLAVTFPRTLIAQVQPTSLSAEATAATTAAEYAALALPETPQPQLQTQPSAPAPSSPAPSSPVPPAPVPPTPVPAAPVPPAPTDPTSSSSSSPQPPAPATLPPATPPPATPATPPVKGPLTEKERHDEAERELQKEEKQRLLGVMPQFQVVMGGYAVPLTAGQKWRLALHSAIDPFYIGWAFVIGGGYGELADSETQRGYGWGAQGYFKRVGSNYADNVNGALIGNALLPALLHQDPRYFRKGEGSIKSRFVYAALSTVICHGDNGKNQFNTSNVLGNFISGAISNAYYPADQRGLGLTLENGLDVTLFGALGGQLLEFGPDLSRLITRHRHTADLVAVPQPAAVP